MGYIAVFRKTMIRTLHIRNYLLIEEIELNFQSGLTVITGETGAGKSLIIDSLELALGARAESNVVRKGSEQAEIYVTIDAENRRIRDWLQEHGLHEGAEAIVQRIIYRDRPSRAYINGRPTTLSRIKSLAARVIAVHGQSEHQTLHNTTTQRHILDGFAGIASSTRRLSELSAEIRKISNERLNHEDKRHRQTEELSLLEHQLSELSQLAPQDNEFSELKQKLLQATHASELVSTLEETAHYLFYGDNATLSSKLASFIRRLEKLTPFDNALSQYAELLGEAQMRIDDVARELHTMAERTEYDAEQIAIFEERMAALQRQARIHNAHPDELSNVIQVLENQINELQMNIDVMDNNEKQLDELKFEYHKIAAEISIQRKKAAVGFTQSVTESMQYLGMAGGRFDIEFISQESDTLTGYGYENVRFMVATSPGQELGPLATVASGGERSRLNLSIQVVASELTQVPAIVFDEVDVGIGGQVAERVGHLLQTLGRSMQIFCITHLPQVAAKGDQQINVNKIQNTTSSVEIQQLDDEQRIMEIARMLSGAKITQRTTEHAKELLAENSV